MVLLPVACMGSDALITLDTLSVSAAASAAHAVVVATAPIPSPETPPNGVTSPAPSILPATTNVTGNAMTGMCVLRGGCSSLLSRGGKLALSVGCSI